MSSKEGARRWFTDAIQEESVLKLGRNAELGWPIQHAASRPGNLQESLNLKFLEPIGQSAAVEKKWKKSKQSGSLWLAYQHHPPEYHQPKALLAQ